jgi:predicted esterase
MIRLTTRKAFSAVLAAALILSVPALASQPDTDTHPSKREDDDTIVFFNPPRVLVPAVTFLSSAPEIDGHLDSDLQDLPVREFSRVAKSAPENPVIPCHYRLGYGTEFLYVYVEADGDRLTFRDRAYQNGDGFAMVLCLPTPDDEPTEDFYVLACSAVKESKLEWTRHVFWYYNVDTIFLPTGDDTKLEFTAKDGKISFELYLPWKDVHPYHPWISQGIGFNMMFTRAVGGDQTNWYRVIPGTVGGENLPRWYGHLDFQEPQVGEQPQTFVSTNRGNTQEGNHVLAIAVTCASRAVTEEVQASVEEEGGNISTRGRAEYWCGSGVTRHEFEVLPADLPQGDYVFTWKSKKGKSQGEIKVTVLPHFDRGELNLQLADIKGRVPPSSYNTLEFKLQRVEGLLNELPPYEVASYERAVLERVRGQLDQASHGEDPYADITGALRRAFRSELDNTLQPYVVRIPDDYDPAILHPLLVFLHGSASTETDILGFSYLSPGGMIEIGPFGRGRSNGFATPEAQIDVAEAIADAISNYPIDTDRIILTGFSMGGYGVYRTFYESPDKFKALAVFSGSPELGRGFAPDSDPPSFLEEESLKAFNGVPIFIYHGEQDRNVSFSKTLEVVEALRAIGAQVEFHSDPDRGHQAPSDDIIKRYHEWVQAVMAP